MWNENYRWHFDYVRLACDAGFSFSTLKSSVALEKSNIGILDVEQVIRSKDVGIVERFIPVITHFKLDPEQSQILDANFIKLFMVAQLAIEYLNFCKMYLDNTVVLLKKELSKIKEDRDALKNNVSLLKKKSKEAELVAAYKCENCTKVFSTEEFLLSHRKRRHENHTYQAETDKLQLEIKELKERLNNTEKTVNDELFVKEKVEFLGKDSGGTKVNELQQKFEILKAHVESELKLLQTQKSFQDKYERWFEVAFNNLMLPQNTNSPSKTQKKTGVDSTKETATQIDFDSVTNEEIEKRDCAVQTRQMSPTIVTRVHQIQASPTSRKSSVDFVEVQEKFSAETKKQVDKIERVLEQKLTGGIEKIENQMSSFWTKLNEIEWRKQIVNVEEIGKISNKGDLEIEISSGKSSPALEEVAKMNKKSRYSNVGVVKKKIKSEEVLRNAREVYGGVKNAGDHVRGRDSSASSLEEVDFKGELPIVRPASKESTKTIFVMNPKPRQSIKKAVSASVFVESTDETSDDGEEVVVKPSNTSTLARHSITSLKQLAADAKLIKELEGEVEIVLNKHLEEMGVSPQWKGIPKRTFEQTMRVVKHQATLAKKSFPQYQTLRDRLIKNLQSRLKRKPKKRKKPPTKMSFSGNLKKINYVPVVDTETGVFRVESKAKSMYGSEPAIPKPTTYKNDTKSTKSMPENDLSDDSIKKAETPLKSPVSDAFKGVIQELKSVQQAQQEEPNKNETKSALKNYPSVGSLTRKKVLFDLDSEDDKKQTAMQELPMMIKPVESGSTTSVASSVLDGSKTNLNIVDVDVPDKHKAEADKNKDSDWDISDLLS